jgi:hypothetical protein
MKFTIAANIVLAQTIPAAISQTSAVAQSLLLEKEDGQHDHDLFGSSRVHNDEAVNHQPKRSKHGTLPDSQDFRRNGSLLKNKILSLGVQSCDPSSNDPDVGILSCDLGYECAVDPASSLGGVCMAISRELKGGYLSQYSHCFLCNNGYVFGNDNASVGNGQTCSDLHSDVYQSPIYIMPTDHPSCPTVRQLARAGGCCVPKCYECGLPVGTFYNYDWENPTILSGTNAFGFETCGELSHSTYWKAYDAESCSSISELARTSGCCKTQSPPVSRPVTPAPAKAPTPRPVTPAPVTAPTPRPVTPAPVTAPTPLPVTDAPTLSPTTTPETNFPTIGPSTTLRTHTPTVAPVTIAPTSTPTATFTLSVSFATTDLLPTSAPSTLASEENSGSMSTGESVSADASTKSSTGSLVVPISAGFGAVFLIIMMVIIGLMRRRRNDGNAVPSSSATNNGHYSNSATPQESGTKYPLSKTSTIGSDERDEDFPVAAPHPPANEDVELGHRGTRTCGENDDDCVDASLVAEDYGDVPMEKSRGRPSREVPRTVGNVLNYNSRDDAPVEEYC